MNNDIKCFMRDAGVASGVIALFVWVGAIGDAYGALGVATAISVISIIFFSIYLYSKLSERDD